MARTKKESIYKNWREIDNAIRRLGNLDIKKAETEGVMTLEINNIKERYAQEADEIKAEQARLKTEIERFCEQNKGGFLKKRHKKLIYGSVAYRISESVKYLQPEESIISSLKALNLDFVLKVNEKINKEKIKELPSNTLTKIGVEIVKKDGLTILPDTAKIAEEGNNDGD